MSEIATAAIEIDGRVLPGDGLDYLNGSSFAFETMSVVFRGAGAFRCAWNDWKELDACKQEAWAFVAALVVAYDEDAEVEIGAVYERQPDGSIRATATATFDAVLWQTKFGTVKLADGWPSPNPDETAWLATLLRDDPLVEAVAAFLRESQRATRMRTRDDWIAFEIMQNSIHAANRDQQRERLGNRADLSLEEVDELGDWLQDERHERTISRSKRPGFDANKVHRLVHKIFLAWARHRANEVASP